MDRDQERAIEWDCAKVLTQFYLCVDGGEYEAAAEMYTEDGFWAAGDLEMHGREAICKSMQTGLTTVFVQHCIQNIVVNVIDEDHADSVLYASVYRQGKVDILPATLPSIGPWFIGKQDNKMVRTSEGWKIARKDIVNFLQRGE